MLWSTKAWSKLLQNHLAKESIGGERLVENFFIGKDVQRLASTFKHWNHTEHITVTESQTPKKHANHQTTSNQIDMNPTSRFKYFAHPGCKPFSSPSCKQEVNARSIPSLRVKQLQNSCWHMMNPQTNSRTTTNSKEHQCIITFMFRYTSHRLFFGQTAGCGKLNKTSQKILNLWWCFGPYVWRATKRFQSNRFPVCAQDALCRTPSGVHPPNILSAKPPSLAGWPQEQWTCSNTCTQKNASFQIHKTTNNYKTNKTK